jgi:glycosyltransferase involved in cell wall biosynthesis
MPLRGFHKSVAAVEARFTYKLARRIICVSEPAKTHLVESWQVDPGKVVVIPNGVDVELFRPRHDPGPIREEMGLDGAPVITFVGGLQHWHGLDRLIDSLAKVLLEIPQVKLLLVGDGRARQAVEQQINELGIGRAVIMTGLVPQVRVPEMLAAADIAVLPYPQLPRPLWFSPLKLYEYMAAGKAIVASRDGQIAQVIRHGHNGLLVDPGDVDGLAQAVIELLRDPTARERLGRNARQQAVERHSWDHYISRITEVYQSVLQASPNEGQAS